MNKVPVGAIIAGLLVAIGGKIAALPGWHDMTTTAFVGGTIFEIGGIFTAVWGAIKYQSGGDQ